MKLLKSCPLLDPRGSVARIDEESAEGSALLVEGKIEQGDRLPCGLPGEVAGLVGLIQCCSPACDRLVEFAARLHRVVGDQGCGVEVFLHVLKLCRRDHRAAGFFAGLQRVGR